MKQSFGEFLKQKRQEKNLTQKEIAKELFVSESAVSKWEKDIAHPDITLLPKLSELLGVTEHELITASIDRKTREEESQAKKWRAFSMSWSLFFYIAYAVAIIPCFITNLAIDERLTWFWIIVSALLLAFTFTNLPKLIKKYKLLLLPLSMFLALCLLLGVCCVYTNGDWFWIAILSVLLGLIMIFTPIYIAKFKIFDKVKKYNDFVSITICFVVLNILLVVINAYTVANGSTDWWYVNIALPIVVVVYLIINLLVSVKFLKINGFLKTGIILLLIDLCAYVPPLFIKVNSVGIQQEIDALNVFKANFKSWITEVTLDNNIHCIIALTLFVLSVIFITIGAIRHIKNKNKN